MMKTALQRIKNVMAIKPQSLSGTTASTSAIIDRMGFASANLILMAGAVGGEPTGAKVAVIIQHGDAANLSDAATFATVGTFGADDDPLTNAEISRHVKLDGAKRYIKVVGTPAFTGGTTPSIPFAAAVALGDGDAAPVDSNDIIGA